MRDIRVKVAGLPMLQALHEAIELARARGHRILALIVLEHEDRRVVVAERHAPHERLGIMLDRSHGCVLDARVRN